MTEQSRIEQAHAPWPGTPPKVALRASTRLGRDVLARWLADAVPGGAIGDDSPDLLVLGYCWDPRPAAALIDDASRACADYASVPVVAVIPSRPVQLRRRFVELGCRGVIPVDLAPQSAIGVLRAVMSGDTVTPALPPERAPCPPAPPFPLGPAVSQYRLSRREGQVLALLMAGQSNRRIAESLAISENTVMVHVRHVLQKLGAINRTQAVYRAVAAMNAVSASMADP